MQIDWARVAQPQPDGYDSAVIAELLQKRFGWVKASRTDSVLVGGDVAVAPCPFKYQSEYMLDASADVQLDELAAVDKYLAAWPDGYLMLGKFLDEFWPMRMDGVGRGSSSGHQPMNSWNDAFRRTAVYVTTTDPEGCATGVYHEVGHLRLEALGMDIDDHDGRLITNPIEDLYDSPVRKDVQRPMCAVIHGLYAWIMLSECDLWCADTISSADAAHYLRNNIPKIENGILEVERYVQPTPNGAIFISSMLDWARDVVQRGRAIPEMS